MKIFRKSVDSLLETNQLAQALAKNLTESEVIEFRGDLGSGKTTFVRFLVGSLEPKAEVSSPSFTIENIYLSQNFPIHHFDFYRLDKIGIEKFNLIETLDLSRRLVLIEWPDLIEDLLPRQRLKIEITNDFQNSTARTFVFHYPEILKYLVQGL